MLLREVIAALNCFLSGKMHNYGNEFSNQIIEFGSEEQDAGS